MPGMTELSPVSPPIRQREAGETDSEPLLRAWLHISSQRFVTRDEKWGGGRTRCGLPVTFREARL